MPQIQKLWLSKINANLVNCKLGTEGGKHLTKAKWLKLEQINIGI